MSRIMFRQKTPEEVAADAAAKAKREASTAKGSYRTLPLGNAPAIL